MGGASLLLSLRVTRARNRFVCCLAQGFDRRVLGMLQHSGGVVGGLLANCFIGGGSRQGPCYEPRGSSLWDLQNF